MQPLAYYGLNLTADTEKAIDNLDLNSRCGLLSITADLVGDEIIDNKYEGIHTRLRLECDKLTTPQRLALIRGLCDRIEIKLMEQSK